MNKLQSKLLHVSFVVSIVALLGALLLFTLVVDQAITTVILLLVPLFIMGGLALAVIDFVLLAEYPSLRRKAMPIVSILLSLVAFGLYLIGLGGLA